MATSTQKTPINKDIDPEKFRLYKKRDFPDPLDIFESPVQPTESRFKKYIRTLPGLEKDVRDPLYQYADRADPAIVNSMRRLAREYRDLGKQMYGESAEGKRKVGAAINEFFRHVVAYGETQGKDINAEVIKKAYSKSLEGLKIVSVGEVEKQRAEKRQRGENVSDVLSREDIMEASLDVLANPEKSSLVRELVVSAAKDPDAQMDALNEYSHITMLLFERRIRNWMRRGEREKKKRRQMAAERRQELEDRMNLKNTELTKVVGDVKNIAENLGLSEEDAEVVFLGLAGSMEFDLLLKRTGGHPDRALALTVAKFHAENLGMQPDKDRGLRQDPKANVVREPWLNRDRVGDKAA